MKKQVFALSFLILFLEACITIAPMRMSDDGSSQPSVMLSQENVFEEDGFVIENIDQEKLKTLLADKDSAWVVLWAPWCSHCVLNMISDYYPNQAAVSGIKPENIIFISSNYDFKNIKKFVTKTELTSKAYVLDAKIYGSNEGEKIHQFVNAFTKSDNKGVPQNFLFTKGEMVYHSLGVLNIAKK